MGTKRDNARLEPKGLALLQKRHRVEVEKEMLNNVAEDTTFIKLIITSDETWVYEYNAENVQQSSDWRSKKFAECTEAQPSRSFKIKSMSCRV